MTRRRLGWMLAPVVVVVLILSSAAPAMADRPFTTRFSTNDTGNIAFAANSLMVCPASAAGCTAARNTPPIASGTNNGINNNNYNMQYVNAAPGAVPGSGASFDSSSATLSLPPTATVLFAGLYWGADTSAGTGTGLTGSPAPNAALRNQVGLQVPGGTGYTSVTANQLDVSSGSATRYNGFADVTAQVQAAGAGTYSVANVQAGTGGDRYAGWTLVVAYRDPTMPPRNLTVDDGFITVSSGSPPTTIPITGFRTPPSGAVQTTLGFVGYEGDSGLTGDSTSLNGTTLSDGSNPANNFWSSAISNLGTNVTARTPNDINNFAYDSKLVGANGILKNNATSANVVVTTSGDTYYPAVVTLATNLYAPSITSTKTVTNLTHPGGPDQLGDTLQYTVSYTNTGSDAAANFAMRDSIPAGTTYVPGSLHIGGSAGSSSPTDALGDDAGEFNAGTGEVVFRLGVGGNGTTGGQIRPGDTDTATFDVTINASDSPGQQIVNQATATFTGFTLGTPFSDTSPQVTNTVSAPSLTLAKSHTGSLIAGQATTFALAVSNVGNLATNGTVTVTDPFPATSFSSIANANGDGWSCSIAGLTLTCTRGDALAAGNSYPPIFVDGTVQDPAPATVSNTATVSGGGSAPATGSDGGGASGLADVSLTKSADSPIVSNGATVTYTLNVQNTGPSAAQNVVVSDPVDPGSFSDVSAQSTQGTCDTAVSCSLGTLGANASATITITATVVARDTTVTNTASVSSSTPDPNPSNNDASATITVPASADLSIAKTGTANPNQGGPDSYTLTVTNNGPDSAHGVVVNDTLPTQFTATSAAGPGFTCTLPPGPGGTVVCRDPLLTTAASPVTVTISGTIAAGTAGQTIADAATVSSNSDDPDLTNNTATFNQLIGPAADLTITKTALLRDGVTPVTNPLAVGDNFIYALRVTNNGPSPASTVSVTDALPTGITLVSATTSQGSCSAAGQTVTCGLGTVGVGAPGTVTIRVTVTVGAAAANTTPSNTATVSSPTPDPNPAGATSATSTIGVGNVANLSVQKSVSPQTANVGDTVTFTLAATNDISIGEGAGAPSGLGTTGGVITDTLPAGLRFVSSSSCTAAGQAVTCHLGPIAQAQIVTATFTARVTAAVAGTSVTNVATIASEAAGGFPALPDFNPADSTDSATLNVNPEADLSITKTASKTNPAVDDEVEYTLTASNAGPNDATGVTIADTLPAGVAFIDASPGCDNENGIVRCDVGTVANGATTSVTIRTHTTAAIAGMSVSNLATVSSDDLDPTPANNTATATINVQPLVDLELRKVASNPAPIAGGPVSYTLSLVNNGPSPATGVTITDPLPSGLSFVTATPGQGSCSAAGQTVTCQLGTLAAGGSALVTVTADVAASTAGTTVTNTAGVTANEPIAQPELTRSSASVTPHAGPSPGPSPGPPPPASQASQADLAIVKQVNRSTGRTGEPLTYTITVTNHGPATAEAPTVADAFSAPASVVSVHTSSGTCRQHGTITCMLDSIADGAHETITIVAKPTRTGELRNTASVSSATPDPDGANNVAHVTTNVRPGPAALRLTKTANVRTVAPGHAFAFTISVRSLGPEPALGVEVCDRLGSGMTFISVGGASFHRGRPCWKVSSLPKGKVRRFTVHVRALLTSGPGRLTNSATATGLGVGARRARATVVVTRPPAPAPSEVTG